MKRFNFLPLFLILVLFLSLGFGLQPFLDTGPDFANCPIDLKNLIEIECQIVPRLMAIWKKCEDEDKEDEDEDLVHHCDLEETRLHSYLSDFETTLLKDLDLPLPLFASLAARGIINCEEMGSNAAENVLKIYRTLRRFLILLPDLLNTTNSNDASNEVDSIKETLMSHQLPEMSDLENSMFSILSLNQIYKTRFTEFLQGKVGRHESHCVLTSEQLVEIGKAAGKNARYSQAVDAFAAALWNAAKKRDDPSDGTIGRVNVVEMFKLLMIAIQNHDEKIQGSIELEDIQPNSGPLVFDNLLVNITHPNFKNRVPVREETVIPFSLFGEEEDVRLQVIKQGYTFERLCRGETLTPRVKASLKCYLTSKPHPDFILKPLKLEVHNEDPLILQYHDVFSDEEIEEYKNEVKTEMRISRTIQPIENAENGNKSTGEITRYRTSSNAWIAEFSDPYFKKLLDRITRIILGVSSEKITGSEDMQVAAYSPGGHYVPHTDAVFEEEVLDILDPSEFLRGDRLITFMTYLSDVEEGGATAFPLLKMAVKPSRGSALMWYNLHPNGTTDRRMLHGGCSVLYGIKWIANKWIRSDDQMFLRKCPLTQNLDSWPSSLHA